MFSFIKSLFKNPFAKQPHDIEVKMVEIDYKKIDDTRLIPIIKKLKKRGRKPKHENIQ